MYSVMQDVEVSRIMRSSTSWIPVAGIPSLCKELWPLSNELPVSLMAFPINKAAFTTEFTGNLEHFLILFYVKGLCFY